MIRTEIEASAHVLAALDPPLKPFHWEVEFPEVFLAQEPDGTLRRRADGGFDAIVGNPPFMGGSKISSNYGNSFSDILHVSHDESHGNGDLVAHFFRKSFMLIRYQGALGLIATNTIGQGDTRSTGLTWICKHGGMIYSAQKRYKWPGDAAVVVSVVHVVKGFSPGPVTLNGRVEKLITAFLFHAGGHDSPERLHANVGKSFLGSKLYGQGFVFDDTDKNGLANPVTLAHAAEVAKTSEPPVSMAELVSKNLTNGDKIFPYIGGKEVNENPAQSHHRYAINFGQMAEDEARQWPDLMELLENQVKPERLLQNRESRARYWWRFGEVASNLYNSINGLARVLVIARVGDRGAFSFLPAGMIYSEQLIVISLQSIHGFCVLQSRIHELWARFFGSSMKDDLRYTPSDCFETFPFPPGWETNAALEVVGQEYYDYRARLMIDTNKGLTKTYNRFHDPKEKAVEIERLRELHAAMDRAVLAAYGWSGLDTTCGFDLDWCEAEAADEASPDTVERLEAGRFFFETGADARAFASELIGDGKGLPWRYRWRPEVRDDVLARLLLLNQERAAAERAAGLSHIDADEELDPLEDDDEDGDADDED